MSAEKNSNEAGSRFEQALADILAADLMGGARP